MNSMFFMKKHCFVFSLSIPSRNACVHSLRPPLLGGASAGISLTSPSVVAGPALGVLLRIARGPLQQLSGNFKTKKSNYYSQVLKGTRYTQGHTVRQQGERERRPGVLPLLGPG